MAKCYGLKKGANGTKNINEMIPTNGTPVNAVAAVGTLTVDTQPTAGDTMTIGTKVYTFVASGSADANGEVSVGTNLGTAQSAIIAAINGTDGFNVANTLVSAGNFSVNVSTLAARTKGVAGTTVVTTETFTASTNVFNATTLGATTEGVNGTIGIAGKQYIDDSYLYIALQNNTISDNYWRRVSLGSAY